MLPPVTAVSVDVVSLVHADDFHVLLEERGMLSWLNHVKNIRMVVLLGSAWLGLDSDCAVTVAVSVCCVGVLCRCAAGQCLAWA